ncbi:MAG: hypothetical protein KU37_07245 [Sulfuricurvum sp. PC08-66]|nr:MAG: hypothetical protein KU37_07245 [Sulfuricurvum sp. PC08-66]
MRRSGFTLIGALFLLVLVGLFFGTMLRYSGQAQSNTLTYYEYEQAQLLARSATEYALLAISAHERNATNGCVNRIDSTMEDFTITTRIYYIGLAGLAGCDSYVDTIATPESVGTVLIDVIVKGQKNSESNTSITYHRRTLQKP